MMTWPNLYSARRTGDPPHKEPNPDEARTSFQRDYDRLVFSSPFRRLQNKTQVFPLPGPTVFVHNRLTHSLEVASVGRSLGKKAGDAIARRYPQESELFHEFYRHELPYVIAAACLAHDIGNPPFGHSGEDAIRNFFAQAAGEMGDRLREEITPAQLRDFELFEGNANALRILTHPFNEKESSYKLTQTTIASIVKYPSASAEGFTKTGLIGTKKSGYFTTELELYRHIAATLGIPRQASYNSVYARHPFVFLTEAADDICYRIIDLEDAHRLRILSLEQLQSLFLPFFTATEGYTSAAYILRKMGEIVDDNQKVQYLRARWIGLMVEQLTGLFMDHEQDLLAGTLNKPLLDLHPMQDELKAIETYSIQHVYNHRSVLEIEAAGYHVIGGLLELLVGAVMQPKLKKSQKLLALVPPQFAINGNSLYSDVQSIVDFISGMTDLFATDLYRRITGITING